MAAAVVTRELAVVVSRCRCDYRHHSADRHRAVRLDGQHCPDWLLIRAHPENSDPEAQLLQLTANHTDRLAD